MWSGGRSVPEFDKHSPLICKPTWSAPNSNKDRIWEVYIAWECLGEFLELRQLIPNLDVVAVEQNGEDRLGSTSILDHLVREEDVVDGSRIKGSIYRLTIVRFRLVNRVFEEEEDAVGGTDGSVLLSWESASLRTMRRDTNARD